jgi:hypothetical protein
MIQFSLARTNPRYTHATSHANYEAQSGDNLPPCNCHLANILTENNSIVGF